MALVVTKQHFRSSPECHGNAEAITFKPCSAAGAVRQSPRQAGMHKWPLVINQTLENNYSQNLQRSTVWHWLYTSRLTEKLLHSTQKKQQKLRIHF